MRALLVAIVVLCLAACSPPAEEPMLGGPPGQAVLRYRPTWLPERVVETERTVVPHSREQSRTWRPPPHLPPEPELRFVVSSDTSPIVRAYTDVLAYTDPGSTVDINGITGRLTARPDPHYGEAQVTWKPFPGEQVTVVVKKLPDEAEVALRIARSTIRDSSPMFGDPLTVIRAPGGAGTPRWLRVSGSSPADWTLEYRVGWVTLRLTAAGCKPADGLARVRVADTVQLRSFSAPWVGTR